MPTLSKYWLVPAQAKRKASWSESENFKLTNVTVLTERVAHLVLHRHYAPQTLVVVTFTNKAANEMRHRLSHVNLLGEKVGQLVLGTFHSICVRLLRQWGSLIGLKRDFGIADTSVSKSMIKKIIKNLDISGTADQFMAKIASARNLNLDPASYAVQQHTEQDDTSAVYRLYEEALLEANYLDFDMLLIKAKHLLSKERHLLSFVECVLVDEFQDTNSIQYDLLKLFAASKKRLTVVGDPDQSIFGWRNADITNFQKMQKDFAPVDTIRLEQNYRSTTNILQMAMHVVKQDTNRIEKSLYTENTHGIPIIVHETSDHNTEAEFIASQICRLKQQSMQCLTNNDFAILIRIGSLSRTLENALAQQGLQYRVIGSHKFFDRAEVKDLLAYLRLAQTQNDNIALMRILNVPKRGLGDKTLSVIASEANKLGISGWEIIHAVAREKHKGTIDITKIKVNQSVVGKLMVFISLIESLAEMARTMQSVTDMLLLVIESTAYSSYLKSTYEDYEIRLDNVQELLNFAREFDLRDSAATVGSDESMVTTTVEDAQDQIARFLELTSLSTDKEHKSKGDQAGSVSQSMVTIITLHAAKGLEWPCVFIPACEDGVIPHCRSAGSEEQMAEEIRLLYVGVTRAQCLLYCIRAKRRLVGGDWSDQRLSSFLQSLCSSSPWWCRQHPSLTWKQLQSMCDMLRRPIPANVTEDMFLANQQVTSSRHDIGARPCTSGDASSEFGGFMSASMYRDIAREKKLHPQSKKRKADQAQNKSSTRNVNSAPKADIRTFFASKANAPSANTPPQDNLKASNTELHRQHTKLSPLRPTTIDNISSHTESHSIKVGRQFSTKSLASSIVKTRAFKPPRPA